MSGEIPKKQGSQCTFLFLFFELTTVFLDAEVLIFVSYKCKNKGTSTCRDKFKERQGSQCTFLFLFLKLTTVFWMQKFLFLSVTNVKKMYLYMPREIPRKTRKSIYIVVSFLWTGNCFLDAEALIFVSYKCKQGILTCQEKFQKRQGSQCAFFFLFFELTTGFFWMQKFWLLSVTRVPLIDMSR